MRRVVLFGLGYLRKGQPREDSGCQHGGIQDSCTHDGFPLSDNYSIPAQVLWVIDLHQTTECTWQLKCCNLDGRWRWEMGLSAGAPCPYLISACVPKPALRRRNIGARRSAHTTTWQQPIKLISSASGKSWEVTFKN